jgi:cyanophycinase
MPRLLIALLAVLCLPALASAEPGPLVVVGGGGTGPEIVAKTLALAGGKNAIVVVLPQSSALNDAGDDSVKMWLEAGSREAVNVTFDDRAAAAAAIRRATLIWVPGGDQNRFMTAIEGTGLAEIIRERHRAGAVVGGTSAGAAVLAEAMFTGDADLKSLTAGTTVIAKGLGLWPEVLIDQHFLKRQRDNRLISAVMDRPALVGVGIDEGTAVVLTGAVFEVFGKSSVVVIDARNAQVDATPPGGLLSGRGIKVSVLRAGQTYSLK